ncbi:hypothetical protein JG687_00014437 [Phytophthora cactorum]|uniref:RING-type domain-containing protein n=1 Tax=Phytophthora cactorum TaxID=29920 RepID=A0A8T1U1L1_9STRA|nr:hypothetical protein PC120_g9989 [Phytophthora cactorum]KAG3065437.1 hypothetical protein PC121_g11357 [Phytophthora cactorum]KAG4055219.1 hypothetical protein PC123_g9673 [Phytophthora cactorum]KAG6950134.1 hypothetical protein JG687_00014437 [Phytophthora cactorum]
MAASTQRVAIIPSALDAVAPAAFTPVDYEAFPVLCQICMDAPASVFQLCGVECLAEVCSHCLVRHLTSSVYSFYPGVLPKVRCPVCLNLLNKNQWEQFILPPKPEPQPEQETQEPEQEQDRKEQQQQLQYVDNNSHVLDKYVMLCRQSCGFQSPCCHLADYTMLPERYAESEDGDDEDAQLELPIEQVEALTELHQFGVEYCYHRQDATEFYSFLTEKFKDNVEQILWRLLPKIVDEERRAALLLRHLNKNPDTRTICCGVAVCFKCKATNHHGGDCRDFIEDEHVVECRGCNVTVVMVDGCDALHCLCGNTFSWSEEVARQRAQRKLLAPVDNAKYDKWYLWHYRMSESLQKVTNLSATQREMRLVRLLREHRPLLRRVLLARVYRRRLGKKEPENIEEATLKLKSIAESPLTPESPLLSRSASVP